ncbi:MAG: ABC transporter permease [Chloroflexi bacterium]|nr:ABC transporter permease [Chloroflexota bacterium]
MRVIWYKIWRDMAHNKARTLLVVLSIAVGVFAMGAIFGAYGMMNDYLQENNQAWIPIHMTFWGWPFDQAVEDIVLREPEIAQVERQVDTYIRWKLEDDNANSAEWRNARLYARADYDAQRMGRVDLWEGQWPTDRTLVVERQTARHLNISVGSTVVVQFGRREQRLKIVGIIRDSFSAPPQFGDDLVFFSTPETATWLTDDDFNRIDVRLASYSGKEDAQKVIDRLAERIERVGMSVNVYGSWLRDPNEHWFQDDMDTAIMILLVLGVLAVGLSGFLIVNTMNAIVSQQMWQIGVMKVVGATVSRVVRVYLTTALIYGGLALLIAIPAGALGAHWLARWVLEIVNIDIGPLRVIGWVMGMQVVIALVVPLLASLVPVLGGARITAHRAISTYGLGGGFGRGWLDRIMGKIRRLPRPMALSLRNTFRRKARVVLTMLTLVLGGTTFMMVVSAEASLNNTLDSLLHQYGYDVSTWLDRSYRAQRLIEVSESVPSVVKAEVWRYYGTMIKLEGGGERQIGLRGVPPETEIMHPRIVSGRMLLPGDTYAIVLSHKIAVEEGIQISDEIRCDIQDRETVWKVVGLVHNVGDDSQSLVPFATLTQSAGRANYGNNIRIISTQHDTESQEQLAQEMNNVYKANNLEVDYSMSANDLRANYRGGFDILLYLLLSMAGLAALVGGFGLMGTMSINVIERRREIGVMRATGATSPTVATIFVVEGVLLGLLSWLLVVPLSYPGAYAFSNMIGQTLFDLPFEFVYSINGMGLWLVIVVVLSTLASLLPALRATKISVRESLAYE